MRSPWRSFAWTLVIIGAPAVWTAGSAEPLDFTVTTYNLENYVVAAGAARPVKPEASRERVVLALRQIGADVVALQEVGGLAALEELRDRLRRVGLDYPHQEWVEGYDTNIQVALLSRHPVVARRSHPRESFLLRGRRFRTTRGILEVDVAPAPGYRCTVFVVHLKSRRESGSAPQEEIREHEAQVLRRLVDTRLGGDPQANLVVLGDFNDDPDSLTIRSVLGRGRLALVDTRPAERNGDPLSPGKAGAPSRTVAWTHFYGRQDLYSRSDYVLVSSGMAREWLVEGTYVFAFPYWGVASDHRPVVVRFQARDR